MSLAEAGDVVEALGSRTARELVAEVYSEPATTSDLAAAVDTSIQNAQYHLDRLQRAGVIEVVDTWYSSRGSDMDVYAPSNEPLVIVAGDTEGESAVRTVLAATTAADENTPPLRADGGHDATNPDGS